MLTNFFPLSLSLSLGSSLQTTKNPKYDLMCKVESMKVCVAQNNGIAHKY